MIAKFAQFDQPILHGLCSYGIVTRVIAMKIVPMVVEGKVDFGLKSIRARLTRHVFPGDTLLLSFWKTSNGLLFDVKTKERGDSVVVGEAFFIDGCKFKEIKEGE